MTLAAAAIGGDNFDPVQLLLNTGIPGIVVVLLITGRLRTQAEVERLEADNARKDAVIASKDELISSLQAGINDKAIPALTMSTRALERIADRGL